MYDAVICARVDSNLCLNRPGSVVMQCSKCKTDVRVAPTSLMMLNENIPIVCLECVIADVGVEELLRYAHKVEEA
jgi:hypothetical protein